MKTIFLYTFLFFLTFSIFAQKKVNFITDYYPLINQAEIEITKNNFKKALKIYQKAFQGTKMIGFRTDHENALYCALKIDNFDFAFNCIKKMANHGYKLEYIQNNKHLEKLRNHKDWKEFETNYENYYLKGKNIDLFLRDTLLKMKELDQKYKILPDRKNYKKEDAILDSLNHIAMFKLFDKYGEFSEENTGLVYSDFGIIIRHYYQTVMKNNQYLRMDTIMFKSVRNGSLNNNYAIVAIATTLYPLWNKFLIPNLYFKVDTCLYKVNLSKGELDSLNRDRKELGLSSVEEHEKKLLYYYQSALYTKFGSKIQMSSGISDVHPFYFWVHDNISTISGLSKSDKPNTKNQQWLDEAIKIKRFTLIPKPKK